MDAPRDLRADDPGVILREAPHLFAGPVEPLPSGQSICVSPPLRTTERGRALDIHRWTVLRVVPPRTARLAIFSTTVALGQGNADEARRTLMMLLEEVRACDIADAPPAPSGRVRSK